MSNTPGISPITPDIEEVRHSDEDGFFGDQGEGNVREDETDDDGGAHTVVEDGQTHVPNP